MLKDTLCTLCSLPGPSGWEDAVRDFLRREAEPFADALRVTPQGTLLVFKRGRKRPAHSLMLAAHMDEVGLLIRSITDQGFLRFAFVGGVDVRVVLGKRVLVGEKAIPGVIGMKPIHLVKREEADSVPEAKRLYIDIGAASKEEAEALVEPGDYGVFAGEWTELHGGRFRAKAIDDRFGCALLLETLKQELPVDSWFAFTTQEEIGSRGAYNAANAVHPELTLICEATSACDIPLASGAKRVCALGAGPVIPLMDRGAIYDPALFRTLTGLAESLGLPWQTKSRVAGGTDARAFQQSGPGSRVAALSAPVRYIHSPSGVADLKDLEAISTLLNAFLEQQEVLDG